jgi:hypothetical protein
MVNGIPLFDQGDARAVLKQHCRRAKVSIRLLDALVHAELEQVGKRRKAGLWERFDDLLGPAQQVGESEEED